MVVEEYLDGPEVSLFALSDGTTVVPMLPAQDFKRIFDGDAGPEHRRHGRLHAAAVGARGPGRPRSQRDVLQPTIDEMARRGTPFQGLLYAGLALTSRGLRVVEFNARFGDPETQPLLALLDSPLSPLLVGGRDRHAGRRAAARVEARCRGGRGDGLGRATPSPSSKGDVIVGTETLDKESDVHVLHAGTALDADGRLVTAGGRVLAVTAVGSDVADARAKAYEGVASISFPGAQWRHDIAEPLVERLDQRAAVGDCDRDGPQRAGHPVRRCRPGRDLVARAQDRPRAPPLDRGARGAARPRRRRTRRSRRGLRDVVDKVDLDSIAARERVTRHDVKARIEEFAALAGHEHIHKGMTSRDLTENVEQLQVRASLAAAARPSRRHPGPAGPARRPSTRRP